MNLFVLTANLAGPARPVTHEGRSYLSAPMTLIVSGVLPGSSGPLFYPPEEIARTAADWDGVPIVLEHPLHNGQRVSAHVPGVLADSGLGFVAQPSAWGGALRAEGWFDLERTGRRAPEVLHRLLRGERTELSTGLYLEAEPRPGTFNGIAYHAIARNLVPDHLAILQHERGACSLSDGCGVFNTHNLGESSMSTTASDRDLQDLLAWAKRQKAQLVNQLVANCGDPRHVTALQAVYSSMDHPTLQALTDAQSAPPFDENADLDMSPPVVNYAEDEQATLTTNKTRAEWAEREARVRRLWAAADGPCANL